MFRPLLCRSLLVRWAAALLSGGLFLWETSAGVAQEGAGPPPDGGGGGGAIILQEDTSGLFFEWVLVAIGVGGATFAVCRSSRRN